MRARVETDTNLLNSLPRRAEREPDRATSHPQSQTNNPGAPLRGKSELQYFVVMLTVCAISLLNICLTNLIGYEANKKHQMLCPQ